MLQQIQDRSVQLLETIVERLDQFETLQKRPKVFAKEDDQDGTSSSHEEDQSGSTEKLKQLSFELIDIGLYSSQLGLELVKEKQSDVVSNLQDRVKTLDDQVRAGKVQLYKFFNDRVYTPLKSNLYVIYDGSTQILTFMMQVVIEKQTALREYLAKNYENVQVLIKENWMRLDFNKDGHVSIDDIKQGAQELFEFLKSFDYLQAATTIKSSLYQEAIKYMKKDLGSDQKKRVTSGDVIEMDDFSQTRQ